MGKKAKMGTPAQQVRVGLNLAVWQMRLAVEDGLLTRLSDASYEPVQVARALSDPERFHRELHAAERLNATEAAADLGVSVPVFKRAMSRVALEPAEVVDVRKYGQVLTVRKWRRGDLRRLVAPVIEIDEVLRESVAPVARSEAAKKAASTRRRNAEQRTAAVEQMESALILGTLDTESTASLCRLHVALSDDASGEYARDAAWAESVSRARLAPVERDEWLARVEAAAGGVMTRLEDVWVVEQESGIDAQAIRRRVPMVGHKVLLEWVELHASRNPNWATAARAAFDQRTAQRAERERDAIAKEAWGHQVPTSEVAASVGLDVETLRALLPGGVTVGALMKVMALPINKRPVWAQGAERARGEIARLAAVREAENAQRAARVQRRRELWAGHLGVDVDLVPDSFAKSTAFSRGHRDRSNKRIKRFNWVAGAREETASRRLRR